MSDERDHGFSPEPDYACPLIDGCLVNIRGAINDLSRFTDEFYEMNATIGELKEVVDNLESIRYRCEELREWGGDWRSLAVRNDEELTETAEALDVKEGELSSALEEIEELEGLINDEE